MSEDFVINIAKQAMTLVLLLAAPALGLGMIVGLAVSILQATTQIQEQTLTFVPKIVVVFLSILFFGSWMLNTLLQFTQDLFTNINTMVR
ncbi:MAG: flagellar biosynthesis protein FliQ [Bacillota bacterium]